MTTESPNVMAKTLGSNEADGRDFHSTTPNNSYNDEELVIEFYKEAQIAFLIVLFLLIVIGNSVLLAAIALSRERRSTRINFFIVNVALCDLLTGPLVVLTDIITKVYMYWYAGEFMCRFVKFLQVIVMYASTYMLVALSIDRLDAVARPMQFKGSGLRVKVLVGVAWGLSCVFALPQLVLFKIKNFSEGPMCFLDLETQVQWQVYISLVATSLFFIPANIILVCYVSIVCLIFKRSHLLQDSTSVRRKDKHRTSQQDLLRQGTQHSVNSQSSRGIIPQAKIRTIQMTFLIVLVFILCWSPYFVFNLCSSYGLIPTTATWSKVTTFIQSMAPLNSAANPIIYGIFSTRICSRVALVKKFSRVMRQRRYTGSVISGTSGPDYTSMTETEDFRLTTDVRQASANNAGAIRVPLINQKLTEADRELLSLHVRGSCHATQGDDVAQTDATTSSLPI